MNDAMLDRLKADQTALLAHANELGSYRMSPDCANTSAHARDLVAQEATAAMALHQIIGMRIKLEEYERATAQPE